MNTKTIIHKTNRLLSHPYTVLVILLFLFAYFAYGNTQFQRQNRQLLENTKQSVDNSQTIIKNLQTAVSDLKADSHQQNAQQTTYLECLINFQRAGIAPRNDQCVNPNESATTSQPSSSTSGSTQPSSGTQATPTPSTTPAPPCKVKVLFVCFKA